MWKLYNLMSPSFWQYHRNIKIKITDNRHFVFVYLLGKLDHSFYGQRNKNRLYIYCKRTFIIYFAKFEIFELKLKKVVIYVIQLIRFFHYNLLALTSTVYPVVKTINYKTTSHKHETVQLQNVIQLPFDARGWLNVRDYDESF